MALYRVCRSQNHDHNPHTAVFPHKDLLPHFFLVTPTLRPHRP